MGLWLPLALADAVAAMFSLARMWAANPKDVELPTRAELLENWCLPMLSRSVKAADEAAEKERKAKALYESVKRLKAKFEGVK